MKKSTTVMLAGILGGIIIAIIAVTIIGKQTIPEETGIINVFFCPRENCEQVLASAINASTKTVQCAFYDLTLNKTMEVLKIKEQRGINVEVIIDKENYKKVKQSRLITAAKNKALMHNKFCVIDNNIVITGSMNPTTNDATKNNNNLMILTSKTVAKNYEEEFSEMKKGVYGKGKQTQYQKITFNNKTLENYFCPEDHCEQQVIKTLNTAKESIVFMTFSFTSKAIAETLITKKQQGILVKGITEERRISRKEEQWKTLTEANITVTQDHNPHLLHHKVFIIDNAIVILGSYNPTAAANTKNDENIIITYDETIAQRFVEEFEGLR